MLKRDSVKRKTNPCNFFQVSWAAIFFSSCGLLFVFDFLKSVSSIRTGFFCLTQFRIFENRFPVDPQIVLFISPVLSINHYQGIFHGNFFQYRFFLFMFVGIIHLREARVIAALNEHKPNDERFAHIQIEPGNNLLLHEHVNLFFILFLNHSKPELFRES